MADCRKCKHNYKMPGDEPKCNRMCDGESDFEPITNAMKIRSMSDEELADFLIRFQHCDICDEQLEVHCTIECVDGVVNWLQSEAE